MMPVFERRNSPSPTVWGLSLLALHYLLSLLRAIFISFDRSGKMPPHCSRNSRPLPESVFATSLAGKIERFSDNAAALSLYPLASKEQQLLLRLLVKNDSSFSDASVIDAQGKEVLKVSDRQVFFPSDLTDQSQSTKFTKALKGEDYISSVHTSRRAQPYITLAIPIWGGSPECYRRCLSRS